MANHGFIASRLNIKPDEVKKYLQEINQKRFNGKLCIDEYLDEKISWFINYKDDNRQGCSGFHLWIKSPKKLEMRHPYGVWMPYVMTVFTEELSVKLNGTISDEGINDKWKGNPSNYPSFRKWVRERYSNNQHTFIVYGKEYTIDQFIESDLSDAPEELLDY